MLLANNVSIAKTPAKESGAEQETVLGVAIAQYQWKARNESELNFSKGERIEILEQLEMRWKVSFFFTFFPPAVFCKLVLLETELKYVVEMEGLLALDNVIASSPCL